MAESCGFRPVSPLSTPLQLRRHSFHVLIYPIVRRRRRVLAPLVCRLRACGMRTSSAPREGSRTRETRATLWKRRSRRYARGMSHRWGASGGSESFFGSRTSQECDGDDPVHDFGVASQERFWQDWCNRSGVTFGTPAVSSDATGRKALCTSGRMFARLCVRTRTIWIDVVAVARTNDRILRDMRKGERRTWNAGSANTIAPHGHVPRSGKEDPAPCSSRSRLC